MSEKKNLQWPAEKSLTKPENTSAPVWEFFRCELLAEPVVRESGKVDKYTEYVWCLECKKEGKIARTTWPVSSVESFDLRSLLMRSNSRRAA